MSDYSEEFEKWWQKKLNEKVWANGTYYVRRHLYTEGCLTDFKAVTYQAWRNGDV